jgi:acetyltransferase-like isoleucine patch superfamily enzyme
LETRAPDTKGVRALRDFVTATSVNNLNANATSAPGVWTNGALPANVRLGNGTLMTGDLAFKRFQARGDEALLIGENCTMDGVHFDLGEQGKVMIGHYCYFTNVVLLCELEVRVGNYVLIGWNTTITDTDFHPIAPAERIADAIACSPLGNGRPRPPVVRRPVVIEDDVWIGPNAAILKGVRIGRGAFVEPGSLVTRDVPPGARVMGSPAQIIGEVT